MTNRVIAYNVCKLALSLKGSMGMLTRPNWQYLVVAAILGLIQLILGIASPFHPIFVSYILDFLIIVLAFIAGQHAKLNSGHPGWFASATGAIFGLVAGLAPFFVTITASELMKADPHASRAKVLTALKLENSAVAHSTEWLMSVFAYGILTLIIGSMGGLIMKRTRDHNAI